jgi:CheY-like chemotaxis protein
MLDGGIAIRSNGHARILLAEDNPACQKLALAMLQRLSYETDAVNNGLEVLQALKRHIYVLVLMDIVMPLMDGIETTQVIRRSFPASEQPRSRFQLELFSMALEYWL